MNILLTGAAGFVGSNILQELNDGINKITVFDNLKTGYITNIQNNVKFINIDCSDEKILEAHNYLTNLNKTEYYIDFFCKKVFNVCYNEIQKI